MLVWTHLNRLFGGLHFGPAVGRRMIGAIEDTREATYLFQRLSGLSNGQMRSPSTALLPSRKRRRTIKQRRLLSGESAAEGDRYRGGRDAPICSKVIIQKFQVEYM